MDGNEIKIYKYTRGVEYSCHVIIIDGMHATLDKITYPSNASLEVIDKLMDDAERFALKRYAEEKL